MPDQRRVGLVTFDAKDPETSYPPIEPLRPPPGAPNVLVILIDDVGFGASSAFGGPCATPTAERLAADGLKFTRFHGVQQIPYEGVSMRYAFDGGDAAERHETQYFEMFCNRGIYHKGWTAVTRHSTPWDMTAPMPALDDDVWELCDDTDWTQARDLAAAQPERLAALQRLWLIEVAKYNVLPLDDRRVERFNSDLAGRPTLAKGTSQLLFGGMGRLSENSVLNLKNKSHAVTAEISVPDGGAEGVIVSQGGEFGGWSLYLVEGTPRYCYNLFGVQSFTVASETVVPAGVHQVRMEFTYDGGGLGKGGDATLFVDGDPVGKGRIGGTVPMAFSADETLDVGTDTASPVAADYPEGGTRFTGRIAWMQLDIGESDDDHLITPEERLKVAMARQ